MHKIEIQKAEIKDANQIGRIAYQVALIHYQQTTNEFKRPTLKSQTEYIKQSILDKDILVFKAILDSDIAGYAIAYINTYPDQHFQFHKRGFLGSIGVDENCRRKGVGTALIKAIEKELKKECISILEIDVYTFNIAAKNLYAKLGYEDIKYYKRKRL